MGLFGFKKVRWKDDNIILVNGVRFYIMRNLTELRTVESSYDKILLGKPRWLVEKYINLLDSISTNNIFEIGILKGGSTAFYHAFCNPNKIVAIELTEKPVVALQEYIRQKKCQNTIKPYYGVNQADKKVVSILEDEFPDRDIDLVIDDASHFYQETKESFNMIFPYLKPGGFYIIEDWSWSHAPHDIWQSKDGRWSDKLPLTNLIFEIIMTCPSKPDMIDEIVIDKNNVIIKKGHEHIESKEFDISKSYLTRGNEFVQLL